MKIWRWSRPQRDWSWTGCILPECYSSVQPLVHIYEGYVTFGLLIKHLWEQSQLQIKSKLWICGCHIFKGTGHKSKLASYIYSCSDFYMHTLLIVVWSAMEWMKWISDMKVALTLSCQLWLPGTGLPGQPLLPSYRRGSVLHRLRHCALPHQQPYTTALSQTHRLCPLVSTREFLSW